MGVRAMTEFRVAPRTGENTIRKTGMWCDGVRGDASGSVAIDFCEAYSLNTTRCFAILKHAGFYNCKALAAGWVSRMQFLFDIAKARGLDFTYPFFTRGQRGMGGTRRVFGYRAFGCAGRSRGGGSGGSPSLVSLTF